MKDRKDLFGVILDFAQAIQATGIYPEQHQRVQQLLTRLHMRIVRVTEAIGTIHVGIIGDHFVVDEFPFLEMNPALGKFLRDIREKGIEKFSLREGLTFGELKRFVYFLATGKEEVSGTKWERISYGNIQAIGKTEVPEELRNSLPPSHLLFGATEVLKDLLRSLAHEGKGKSLSQGRDIVASVMKGIRQDAFLIHRLMRLQSHDDYTVTHSLNVCAIVVGQAKMLGIPEKQIQEIGLAAMLHDIGKEMIPAEILQKPGAIDDAEFARVVEHPVLGANILRKLDCGSDLPMIVSFEHHIRYDHSGYPKTASRKPLHPVSYMTQIADVYDALRTYRPYRKTLDMETALSIMDRGRGKEFEPLYYDNFLRMLFGDQAGAGA
jgi:HD-GYP domain-containing protein (c-di-GMP phosphodiesterase class II)